MASKSTKENNPPGKEPGSGMGARQEFKRTGKLPDASNTGAKGKTTTPKTW
jgi:hypothetical protein